MVWWTNKRTEPPVIYLGAPFPGPAAWFTPVLKAAKNCLTQQFGPARQRRALVDADNIATCIANRLKEIKQYSIRGVHRGILVSPTLVTGRALGDGHVINADHNRPKGMPEAALVSITILLPEYQLYQ